MSKSNRFFQLIKNLKFNLNGEMLLFVRNDDGLFEKEFISKHGFCIWM